MNTPKKSKVKTPLDYIFCFITHRSLKLYKQNRLYINLNISPRLLHPTPKAPHEHNAKLDFALWEVRSAEQCFLYSRLGDERTRQFFNKRFYGEVAVAAPGTILEILTLQLTLREKPDSWCCLSPGARISRRGSFVPCKWFLVKLNLVFWLR